MLNGLDISVYTLYARENIKTLSSILLRQCTVG